MLRVVLLLALSVIVSRMFWRIVGSFMEGVTGGRHGERHVPHRGVHMVRDPVCGTFVLPDRAVTLADGGSRLFFCSNACRDKYRTRTA